MTSPCVNKVFLVLIIVESLLSADLKTFNHSAKSLGLAGGPRDDNIFLWVGVTC